MKKYIVTVTLIVAAILLTACTPEEPKKEGTTTPPAATTLAASPAAEPAKPPEPAKPAPTATKPAPTQPAPTPAPTKPAEPVAVTPPATTQPAPAPSAGKGSVTNGAPVYKKNCAGCHGNTGAGDGPAASSLKPKPADFVTAAYKDSKGKNPREYTDAEMLDIINNGRKGTAMPAWKKQLTADQINDVLAYVRSLAK